jgi:MutS domain V
MAGKSTVLRSTAAVALLAAAGLHAPARSATIPYIDAFMLRNFSADSPLEGKSSFAVEMTEMRWVHDSAPSTAQHAVKYIGSDSMGCHHWTQWMMVGVVRDCEALPAVQ